METWLMAKDVRIFPYSKWFSSSVNIDRIEANWITAISNLEVQLPTTKEP